MESETNREIREVLEMFKIDTKKVVGIYSIIGHLKQVAENHHDRELKRKKRLNN